MTAPLPFLRDQEADTSTCRTCGLPAPPGTRLCWRCLAPMGWPHAVFLTGAERAAEREAKRQAFFHRKQAERMAGKAGHIPSPGGDL